MSGIAMLKSANLGIAALLGVALIANGVFMLVAPADWYVAVPGVTATGPFNQHFLRDIGLIFLLLGGAFLVGAAQAHLRVALWAAPSIWLTGHALFHLWEVAVGICSPLGNSTRLSCCDFAGDHRNSADRLGNPSVTRPRSQGRLEHDPEKWVPVFRKDHAQTRRWPTSMLQLS